MAEGIRGSYISVEQDKVLNLLQWNGHEQALLGQLHDRLPIFPQEPSRHAPCID